MNEDIYDVPYILFGLTFLYNFYSSTNASAIFDPHTY